MRRLCERPGCAARAEVSYGMDKVNLVVWIDNSHVPEREHAGRLCRRHADALVVPRDWSIDDRRQVIPLLFRQLADETSGTVRPQPKRTAPRSRDNTEKLLRPSLFEEIEAEVDEALQSAGIDPDETRAIPWAPRLGANAVPEDEPTPTFGRLLGRAFGKTRDEE